MTSKNFRKLNIKAMVLCLGASAFTMSVLLPTMSWFNKDTSSPISVDGNIHGSYFESGDGTAENPFEIARPIQLYYLSWLQEMGYFNEAEEYPENSGQYRLKQQYHFYLSKDLDMDISNDESYVLPPIGTIKYPFVGSFDGKGHVITDLTITNAYNTYTQDPRHPTGSNTHSDSYEILGMFGVLGTTETTNQVAASIIEVDGTIHQLQDSNDDNILVSYTTAGNYVSNVYLDTVTIVASTDSAHALAGAVAGYSNASVTNIGIKGATISYASGRASVNNIGTTNLSDYASFGFVTNEYKRDVDLVTEKVYQPKATASTYVSNSSGSSWGGSVDFQSLNQRMNATKNMPVTNNGNSAPASDVCLPYPIKQTYVNGTLQAQATSTVGANMLNGQNIQDLYHYSDQNAVGRSGATNTLGSYYYTWRDNARRIYLGGYSDVGASSVKTVTRITQSNTTEECYYIRTNGNGGSNYVGVTTSGTTGTTYAQNNANVVIFHYDSSQQCLYTRRNDSNGVSTIYFLNVSGGAYLMETTSNTIWTKNTATGTFSGTPRWKFRIYNGSNYLRINSTTTPSNTTTTTGNNGTGTIWNISNYGTSNLQSGIYATYNGNTYYLNYTGDANNDNATGLRLYRGQYKSWTRSAASGTSMSFKNDTKYLYLNNTTWQVRTSSSTVYLDQDTSTLTPTYETVNDTSYTYTISQERSGQAGYIPLSAVGDGNVANYQGNNVSINNLYAAEINTGYIVGGFYDSSNGGKEYLAGQYFGDARISQYDLSSVSDSYENKAYKTLYTINDNAYNGTGENATQKSAPVSFRQDDATAETFVKLKQSLTGLDRILKDPLYNGDTAQISGIHFMDSTISKERTIKADAVMINGEYKTNYEMPEDSIDFTLKENGYINFLAGNYQSDNNSFFALHKIERYTQEEEDEAHALDPNSTIYKDDIKSIKKIKFVFKDANDPLGDCIYLYENGGNSYTWSDGETLSNRPFSKNSFTANGKSYVFAFDTKWIAVNKTLVPKAGKRLYYFEIPVNVGEYALGSCEGGCGGYLVYLDISAASQIIERKTVNELFEINTLSGEIPYGTQYISSIPNPVPVIDNETGDEIKDAIVRTGISSINDLDSYYGSIAVGASGLYTIDRSGNTITVSGNSSLLSNYIGDGLTLSGDTLEEQPTVVIRRIIDYDYNTVVGTYIKQTQTIRIVGTGNTAHNYVTTKIEYNMDGFDQPYSTIAIYSYDWIGDGPDFQYSYYIRLSATQDNSGIEVNFNNAYNDDFWLTIEYLAQDFQLTCGSSVTIIHSSDIPANPSENDPYPRIQIEQTSDTYDDPDTWYDFTKLNGGYVDDDTTVTPTLIATFNYTREGDQVIEENFIYSGYNNLETVTTYEDTPVVIDIINGSYIYEFLLSNSGATQQNPIVSIYYVASGTYVVRMADGSEYIVFVPPQP